MAAYMPHNSRSEALLKKLGFPEEGLAKKYLQINGNGKIMYLPHYLILKLLNNNSLYAIELIYL